MKKDNKKQTAKSKREAKKVASLESLGGLAERDAKSLVIGIDLGDRTSAYCIRTLGQEIILEGTVATQAEAIMGRSKICGANVSSSKREHIPDGWPSCWNCWGMK